LAASCKWLHLRYGCVDFNQIWHTYDQLSRLQIWKVLFQNIYGFISYDSIDVTNVHRAHISCTQTTRLVAMNLTLKCSPSLQPSDRLTYCWLPLRTYLELSYTRISAQINCKKSTHYFCTKMHHCVSHVMANSCVKFHFSILNSFQDIQLNNINQLNRFNSSRSITLVAATLQAAAIDSSSGERHVSTHMSDCLIIICRRKGYILN
jgi:hypothetical protein